MLHICQIKHRNKICVCKSNMYVEFTDQTYLCSTIAHNRQIKRISLKIITSTENIWKVYRFFFSILSATDQNQQILHFFLQNKRHATSSTDPSANRSIIKTSNRKYICRIRTHVEYTAAPVRTPVVYRLVGGQVQVRFKP